MPAFPQARGPGSGSFVVFRQISSKIQKFVYNYITNDYNRGDISIFGTWRMGL